MCARARAQALFGPSSRFPAVNHGMRGQCVQYGRDPLLEQIRSGKLRQAMPTARAVVVWIGKNHIRGSSSTHGRPVHRAGGHVYEDVRQVLAALHEAQLPPSSPVLVISLFNPPKAQIVGEMNHGLRRLALELAAKPAHACRMYFLSMDDPAGRRRLDAS